MTDNKLYYLIFCGTSPKAIINSIWASIDIEKIEPTNIVLLKTKGQWGLDRIKRSVESLVENTLDNSCSVEFITITESDIEKNLKLLKDYLQNLSVENSKVIFDITPGRKTMSISGLLFVHNAIGEKETSSSMYQKIVYWHLLDSGKYVRKWYPEIPRSKFQFVDLMEVIR